MLASTAAAFALTEGLKLEPSPIRSTAVDKTFSPVCDCPQDAATIHFGLRKADTLTIAIVDASGRVVRTIERQHYPAGAVNLTWDGRGDAGQVLPEGVVCVIVNGETIVKDGKLTGARPGRVLHIGNPLG